MMSIHSTFSLKWRIYIVMIRELKGVSQQLLISRHAGLKLLDECALYRV